MSPLKDEKDPDIRDKPYKCNQCEKTFLHKYKLKMHERIHTGERPYKCNQCEKTFVRNSTLKIHKINHTGERPYKCNQCEKTFVYNSSLKQHELIHTGERPYKCNQCEKTFVYKSKLKLHKQMHTGEMPYKCNHCEKNFESKSKLLIHERTHTGEKPYQCNWCEDSFSVKSSLTLHLSWHTEGKQQKCTFCNMAFLRLSTLKKHMKNIHTKEKLYLCSQCNSTFKSKNSLEIHMNVHTQEKLYRCSQCNTTYSHKGSFEKHLSLHNEQIESNQSSHGNKGNLTISVSRESIYITHLKTQSPSSSGIWLGSVKQCQVKSADCYSNQKPDSEGENISDEKSPFDQSSIPLFCENSTEVVLWFQQNKLLKSVQRCDSCCNSMIWTETPKSKDGFKWICQTKGCTKYQHGECIKSGSFFENSSVTLPDWFDIMYLWSENVESMVTSDLAGVDHTQVIDCYAHFREVCEVYFQENPFKLGGPGRHIEIGVARFSENTSNQAKPPFFVLGIVDSSSSLLNGFMEIVESSDTATILPIILRVVEPDSIIYCEKSNEYNELQGITGMDTIGNHSLNFKSINSTDHVTKIELFWYKHNKLINCIYGYEQNNPNSYLQEQMWRDRFCDDSFKNLCQLISVQYPL